ncbi:hypothetical protein [Flavobacterium sp.]|uniref:hypothetical protein n=1 Tax=Flavobacterium sp. TaxID=239 RepID=UPI003753B185
MTIIIDKNTTRKEFEKKLNIFQKTKKNKGIDLTKHFGVIKLNRDALQIQKEIRSEWE